MVKIMMMLVLLAGAGLFVIKGPGGEPLLQVNDFIDQQLAGDWFEDKLLRPVKGYAAQLLAPAQESSASADEAQMITTVYKWRDNEGVWQFSDVSADVGAVPVTDVEILSLDGRINILPAMLFEETPDAPNEPETTVSSASSVSLEEAAELLQTVKGLQLTVDQRAQEMDKLLKEIPNPGD